MDQKQGKFHKAILLNFCYTTISLLQLLATIGLNEYSNKKNWFHNAA